MVSLETLLTVEDVAMILQLQTATVRKYIRDGKLKAKKIGKDYRITQDELRKFLLNV